MLTPRSWRRKQRPELRLRPKHRPKPRPRQRVRAPCPRPRRRRPRTPRPACLLRSTARWRASTAGNSCSSCWSRMAIACGRATWPRRSRGSPACWTAHRAWATGAALTWRSWWRRSRAAWRRRRAPASWVWRSWQSASRRRCSSAIWTRASSVHCCAACAAASVSSAPLSWHLWCARWRPPGCVRLDPLAASYWAVHASCFPR
mmetsp:Transcript_43379/g.130086  ORF Transcript_43379/g.130086 Transcript_43379/m.130086 type:complete len:203 (-) Transcript_43379:143-751(-)